MGLSEKDAVARTPEPVTIGGMRRGLRRPGIKAGDVLLVHSSTGRRPSTSLRSGWRRTGDTRI